MCVILLINIHLCVSWFPDLCTALPKAEVVSGWVLALPSLKSVLLVSLTAVLELSPKHSPSHSPLLFHPTSQVNTSTPAQREGPTFQGEKNKGGDSPEGMMSVMRHSSSLGPEHSISKGAAGGGVWRPASTALQAPGARGPSSSQEISWFPVWLKSFLSFSQHLFLLQNLSLITYHYSHSHDFFLPKQRFRLSVVLFVPTCGLFHPLHLILLFYVICSSRFLFSFEFHGWLECPLNYESVTFSIAHLSPYTLICTHTRTHSFCLFRVIDN